MHRSLPQSMAAAVRDAGSWLAAPMPASYPNHLAAGQPTRPTLAATPLLWAFLLLACLIPRLLLACRLDVVCVDGALYVRLAQALERGILSPPDSMGMELNFYSVMLVQLHRLGLSWDFAPMALGVALSTLAVLPLFGWVRRQFDDRVATVACLLYAFHPNLIEWSPEAMREPPFWFFFSLALYLMWRAIVEVQWALSIGAGVMITVAALTRVEGLFLFVPLVWWTVVRRQALSQGRRRLLLGTALAAASFPAVLLIVNLAWVGNDSSWALLRTGPLHRAAWWVQSWMSDEPEAAATAISTRADPLPAAEASRAAAASLAAATVAPRLSLREAAWRYLDRMANGLWPPFALLLFGGYFAWRGVFDRRDHLPLAIVGLAIALGAWIHLWNAQDLSSRYVLTIVLLSTRCAALGWLGLTAWAARARLRPSLAASIPSVMLLVIALAGWGDALTNNYDNRAALADLGRWIRAEYGDRRTIAGSEPQLPLVGYYAQANCDVAPRGLNGEPFLRWVEELHPDVVVISQRYQSPQDYAAVVEQRGRLGLELVPQERLPHGLRRTVVLARRASSDSTPRQKRGDSRADIARESSATR